MSATAREIAETIVRHDLPVEVGAGPRVKLRDSIEGALLAYAHQAVGQSEPLVCRHILFLTDEEFEAAETVLPTRAVYRGAELFRSIYRGGHDDIRTDTNLTQPESGGEDKAKPAKA